MKIKVLDHELDFKFIASNEISDEGKMGQCNIQEATILVKKDMDKNVISTTFYHELVHFISITNGYTPSEEFVDAMAIGFHSFTKNNKAFIDKMREGFKWYLIMI